ncbi:MAG TPA: GNAT family N-acetyltransferase [Candidatus Limnocylindrales bacterium]|nr:GNAT family N-acetyltransferase [Candidatus Limnocylindrales bacterium]
MSIARRYLTGYPMRVLVWRDGAGALAGVAALSVIGDRPPIRPIRQLALWGTIGPRMRGLTDVLARDDVRTEVLDGFAAWLRGNKEWDALRVVRPQHGSPTPGRLRQEAQATGWTYRPYTNVRSTTFQLDLPADEEGWAKHLGSKARKVMRWEMRKFADFRTGVVKPAVEGAELTEALESIERLLHERWGDNEVYFVNDSEFRGLLHETVPALVEHRGAWVSTARDQSGVRAVLITFAQNGYAMAFMIAMTTDPDYSKFSLGKHIFDAGLAEAVRRGCHNYDFLWVGGYKESFWHATPRELESAIVGRGLLGRLATRLLAGRF